MLALKQSPLYSRPDMGEVHIPKVAILASGGGTTAEAYARAIHEGLIKAEIPLVVSSAKDAGILDRAARWNAEWDFDTETAVINKRTHPGGPQDRGQTTEESEAIVDLVEKNRCDLVACLGYMVIINTPLIEQYGFLPGVHRSPYQASMLNTHPGPLPLTEDTYGVRTSARALNAFRAGEITESKHTVHVVAQGVDRGPIIAEHPVPVLEDDSPETLNARTQIVEKVAIPYVLDKFIRDQRAYEHGRT